MAKPKHRAKTGLGQFLDARQQGDWLDGTAEPPDTAERIEALEQRFRYAARVEKLLVRPQAGDVLDILGRYGRSCLPIPRTTERFYWSVSCLPSTSDKPLVRVNASWMELFTIYADGHGIRARAIVHLSDFTSDGSAMPERVDAGRVRSGVAPGAEVDWFFPRGADIFGINVRGATAVRAFLASPDTLRAIRRFNLTHMNRGRNAYQSSHCYGIADHMLAD